MTPEALQWAVVEGDAFALCDALPAQSVDVTITDPPYNAASRNARSVYDGKASASSLGRSALGVKGEGIAWDFSDVEIDRFVACALRVTKRWTLVFCALEQIGAYRAAAAKAWKRAGVWIPENGDLPFFSGLWDRNNTGTPQLTGDRPAQGAEGIAIMHNPATRCAWNGKGSRGIWRHSVDRTKGRHPAAKPIPLAVELVRLFSNPGELVFDPFCGGASFGVAALSEGRHYLGCDGGADQATGEPYAVSARRRLAVANGWPCA